DREAAWTTCNRRKRHHVLPDGCTALPARRQVLPVPQLNAINKSLAGRDGDTAPLAAPNVRQSVRLLNSFGSLSEANQMAVIFFVGRLGVFSVVYMMFYGFRLAGRAYSIDQWLPKWDTLLILSTMIILERLYRYRYAVSQRSVLTRDIISNVVNLYVTGMVTGMIVLPALVFLPQHYLGRKMILASSEQLGPFWLQVLVILLSVSFFRYWIHRLQHSIPFLWKLHSYHHRVTDLQASNTF